MGYHWPNNMQQAFAREIITANHDLHERALFSDSGLADLLDRYPRERLGLYTFPVHQEGRVLPLHGRAPDLSGEALLNAVRSGHIWLNLRAASDHLPDFAELRDELFASIEAASGQRTLKQDVGVLISSPNVHVHYHLDIPLVCLVQVRGTKTLHLYPAREPFAPLDQMEAVALREREEDIAFRAEFEAQAEAIKLHPGQAVTWPQNAPHRVQNGDMMNVSLSCEFMTVPGLLRANAIYANGVLRRRFGARPRLPQSLGAGLIARAALARALKLVHRPPEKAPVPVSFEIDAQTLDVTPLASDAA